MWVLSAAVLPAGMHAGVALKPKTPAETLFPYIEKKLIDMVRHGVADAAIPNPARADALAAQIVAAEAPHLPAARCHTSQAACRC